MDRRQFVANHDGNISIRLGENEFLATPTARAKGTLTTEDIITLDMVGKTLSGVGRIFSEWIWHQAIYLEFSDVTSVCHAHPPYAMALGLAGEGLEYSSVPESIVSLGAPIRITDWVVTAKPSLAEIRALVREALETSYAFYVPGNGVFAVGDDAEMSYLRVELLEQISKAHFLARQMGSVRRLPQALVAELSARRPPLKPTWKKQDTAPEAVGDIDERILLEKVTAILKNSLR